MRRPVKVFRLTFLYLFFCFICINYNLYAYSTEENNENKSIKLSLEFNGCSVSEALDQISMVTGVKVKTNISTDKMTVNKYYKDKTIDHIVTDMLSGENYAMIRSFDDKKKLVSIGIWILDWSNERGNLRSVATNNPFEASLIERKNNPFVNAPANKPFEVNHTERNVNKNNPFLNATTNNPFEANRTEKNNPFSIR